MKTKTKQRNLNLILNKIKNDGAIATSRNVFLNNKINKANLFEFLTKENLINQSRDSKSDTIGDYLIQDLISIVKNNLAERIRKTEDLTANLSVFELPFSLAIKLLCKGTSKKQTEIKGVTTEIKKHLLHRVENPRGNQLTFIRKKGMPLWSGNVERFKVAFIQDDDKASKFKQKVILGCHIDDNSQNIDLMTTTILNILLSPETKLRKNLINRKIKKIIVFSDKNKKLFPNSELLPENKIKIFDSKEFIETTKLTIGNEKQPNASDKLIYSLGKINIKYLDSENLTQKQINFDFGANSHLILDAEILRQALSDVNANKLFQVIFYDDLFDTDCGFIEMPPNLATCCLKHELKAKLDTTDKFLSENKISKTDVNLTENQKTELKAKLDAIPTALSVLRGIYAIYHKDNEHHSISYDLDEFSRMVLPENYKLRKTCQATLRIDTIDLVQKIKSILNSMQDIFDFYGKNSFKWQVQNIFLDETENKIKTILS